MDLRANPKSRLCSLWRTLPASLLVAGLVDFGARVTIYKSTQGDPTGLIRSKRWETSRASGSTFQEPGNLALGYVYGAMEDATEGLPIEASGPLSSTL